MPTKKCTYRHIVRVWWVSDSVILSLPPPPCYLCFSLPLTPPSPRAVSTTKRSRSKPVAAGLATPTKKRAGEPRSSAFQAVLTLEDCPSPATSPSPVSVAPPAVEPIIEPAVVPAVVQAVVHPVVVVPVPVVSDSAKSLAAMVGALPFAALDGDGGGSPVAPNINAAPFYLSAFADKNTKGSYRGALSRTSSVTKSDTFLFAGLSVESDVNPAEKNEWNKFKPVAFTTAVSDRKLINHIQVGMCLKVYGAANPGGNNFPDFYADATKFLVGKHLTARIGRKAFSVVEMVDGAINSMPEGTIIGSNWIVDAEISIFFWMYKEMHGMSATLHRIIVRERPAGEKDLNTAQSYLAKYMTK